MKPGLVLDHDMERRRVGGGDLLQEDRVDVPVDGGGKKQLGGRRAVNLQGLVQIAPLVTGRVRRVDPHPPADPRPAG